ncbi:hypothetical protein HanXRQr2_Chr11g0483211 [Helianthus annuus]|uniref:Uncharacterized protein n=1 Tax=Helianthus annuus TaxID=4232 RepID=A0A251T9N9_HELAN|nr:hypothetical protein HanXRQr2_Chr11g0483211 [Helianthus annuus]
MPYRDMVWKVEKLPSSLTYKSLMHFHMWILAFHKPKPGLIAILSIFLDALNRCLLPS